MWICSSLSSFFVCYSSTNSRVSVRLWNACAAKGTRRKNRTPSTTFVERQPFERVEIDMVGPLPLSVPSHYRYIVAFAEAGPIGHVTIQCLAQINEQYLAKAVNDYIQRHPEVKEILYDKAFDVDRVTAVLEKHKVNGRKVSAGSHHRIGHVERFFRTLQTQMIVLVTDAQCPQGYWPLVASHVKYLFNTLPRQRH